MMSSPRLTILIHRGLVTTPKSISSPFKNITERKHKSLISSEPVDIIDLTQSPSSLENSLENTGKSTPHDHGYDHFVNNLNSTWNIPNRQLHPNWKCAQFKKKHDLLADICTTGTPSSTLRRTNNNSQYVSPRTSNVQKFYSPKQLIGVTPVKASLPVSPFTPENQIELRPLRGYRLQDILHRRPITPANYYKNVSYVQDLN